MEKLEFLTNIIESFGVQMRAYAKPFAGLEDFDKGLRSRIFKTFDTGRLKKFVSSIEPPAVYFTEDQFGCHYCFFPANNPQVEPVIIDSSGDSGGGGQHYNCWTLD